MNARGSALKAWKRIADLWCASGSRQAPGAGRGVQRALGPDSHRQRCAVATGRGDSICAPRKRSPQRTGSFIGSSSFPKCSSPPTAHAWPNAGFDAVIGNPPWDMIRADGRGAARDDPGRVAAVHARCRRLHGAVGRPCQPLPALRRARDGVDAAGRPDGSRPARRPRDRPWQRAAAQTAADALRRRRARRLREPSRRLSDSPQRPFPVAHRIARLADTLHRLPLGAATRPISRRSATNRRRRPLVPVRLTPPLLERLSGEELTIPGFARRWICRSSNGRRRCSRRSAASRVAGAVRPRAERDRRPAALHARRCGSAGGRRETDRTVRVRSRGGRWRSRAAGRCSAPRSARYERPRLAYRDVASATNRLTLIAAILPPRCVSTHTVFCLRTPLSAARPVFSVRPVQQLRRELPRPAAGQHPCDDGDRRGAAGSNP